MTVCEENCKFINYNYTTNKVICSCPVKTEIKSISDIKFDTSLLLKNFKDIKNIANFEMLKCIYLMFDKINFFKNTSNYLMIILLIISIIAIFIFSFRDYSIITKKLNSFNKNKGSNKKEKIIDNKKKNKQKRNKINLALNDINHKQINTKNLTKSLNNVGNPSRNMKNIKPLKKEKSKKRKNIQNSIIITNNISNSKNIIHINMSKKPQKKVKLSNKNMIKKNEIDEYNEYKINNLDYPKAIIYDHRTYCQYYISLIKMKHIFIFTFFYNKDYNSRIIKIYIIYFFSIF